MSKQKGIQMFRLFKGMSLVDKIALTATMIASTFALSCVGLGGSNNPHVAYILDRPVVLGALGVLAGTMVICVLISFVQSKREGKNFD